MCKTYILLILAVLAKGTSSTHNCKNIERIREKYESQKEFYNRKQGEFLANTDLIYGTGILNTDEIIELENDEAARENLAERLYDNLQHMIEEEPLGLANVKDSREAFLELNVGLLAR